MPLNLVLLKGAAVIGVFLGETWTREPATADEIDAGMAVLVAAGKIHPPVSAIYSLEQVPQALHALLNRQAAGKLIVRP
jgi:NADPH2:quinone reductase